MRDTSRFAALSLSLSVACTMAVALPPGSSTTGASHSGNATVGANAATSASTTTSHLRAIELPPVVRTGER